MRFPVWSVPLLVAALFSVGLLAFDTGDEDKGAVVVAAKPLPAYHLIVSGDVTSKQVEQSGGDISQTSKVIGTVTRTKIASDSPFGAGAITGKVSRASLDGLVFLRFHVTATQLPGIGPGDEVVLRFTPVAAAVGTQSSNVPALLIDDTIPSSGAATYVIGLARKDVDGFLSVVGRSRMLVTRGSITPSPPASSGKQKPYRHRANTKHRCHHRRRSRGREDSARRRTR